MVGFFNDIIILEANSICFTTATMSLKSENAKLDRDKYKSNEEEIWQKKLKKLK
jgi:hypothetical protein